MNRNNLYQTIRREAIDLTQLQRAEKDLMRELESKQANAASYPEYANYWMARVANHYADSGLTRRQITQTVLWKIAKDLAGRLMLRLNEASPGHDYRDDLDHLIRERFQTRRGFCEATGITEDMLSHVLAHRKHLAVDTLGAALQRIGYRLQIAPIEMAN